MRLFFYGTLLDADVRNLVLGAAGRDIGLTAARLDGWQRRRARGKSYPVIQPGAGQSVEGAVSTALSAAVVARLSAYEGPGYVLVPCRPVLADGTTVAAQVYQPTERLPADDAEWDLAAWQAAEKTQFLARLRRGAQHG